jgi:hypothetical protein
MHLNTCDGSELSRALNACDAHGSEPSHAHLASAQYKLLPWTLTTKIRDTYIPNFGRTEGPRDSQNHKF